MRIIRAILIVAMLVTSSVEAIAAGQGPVRKAGGSTFPGVPSSIVAGIQQNPPSGASVDVKPAQYSFEAKAGSMIRSNISRQFLNRIVTPFLHPIVKTSSPKTVVTNEVVGQTIFVSLSTAQLEPVVLYIMDQGDNLDSVSLMLDPKDVGPVEIDLKQPGMPGSQGPQYRFDDVKAAQWEQSNPYTDTLTDLMRQLGQGHVPPGYAYRDIGATDRAPGCQQAGLTLQPKQVLEGHDMVAFVAAMTNTSDQPIEFQESSCAADGVLAVASWPGPLLQAHQSSEVYIVVRRSATGGPTNLRPSALVGSAP